jgi:prolyl-tRNA synthetase
MKASQGFIRTKKSTAKSESDSTELLDRAGFITQNASGIYTMLPLGFKVMKKIESIIREELESAGVSELLMPVLQPARVWKASGRFDEVNEELWKITNRFEEDFVLSMTAEELILDSLKDRISSYRDLPLILNQFQTKIRDEVRPKGGLVRLREFIMQDAYSFDADRDGMHRSYEKIFTAYERIFKRLGLKVSPVEADSGLMGGDASHEFVMESDIGEAKIIRCTKCDYAANQEQATRAVDVLGHVNEKKQEAQTVHTPGMKSTIEVAEFLRIDLKKTIKTMIYSVSGKIVLVLTRGDMEVNQAKLAKALQTNDIRMASAADIDKASLIPGFTSSFKLDAKFKVVADQSLKLGTNFVVGANKRDYHVQGVTIQDLGVDAWADLALVSSGDPCPTCGSKLHLVTAIELGHTFQLGTKYSDKQEIYYTDDKDKAQQIYMGSYGIGLERQIAILAHTYRDSFGFMWPAEVAPYQIYLLNVGEDEKALKIAQETYDKLSNKYEILFDDRETSAGEKFADADLIGIPYRITVSKRTLAKSSVEIKLRQTKETEMIRIDKLEDKLKELLG